ncbi:phosphomethylpyrimidine synthase ThiC [Anaeroselena agilis]|uniref:Phosphomethylpyrimidine synthase n=1 Tax=Anaeroselena agilis TaxID=3063788 RepID=A0ABU3NW28_9FIRM|nr:phosphomethylpyrimidine synthase ThiC [Selenomonadales bacterium 4137-cl]
MTTQMKLALNGQITPAMAAVAAQEGLAPETIRERVAAGTVTICANINHASLKPRGFGLGLKTKVNANIGTSSAYPAVEPELAKLQAAIDAGADAVMDLSTGDDIDFSRKEIIKHSTVPVGTVPIYQATVEAIKSRGSIVDMTADDLFNTIEKHAKDGADFMTIHCGITQASIARLRQQGRVTDIVSRGGSFITGWMLHNDKENPLYERYDELMDICAAYDVTISLGDGLRPGCIADATDRAQIEELLTLGELVDRAWAKGVQVLVEGPGHVPYNQIEANIKLQKQICKGAPFYVLGPLVTDVAPGYDHITAAIGGTLAAAAGADFLCYVTPAEHLGLPTIDDVREGVIASRIAGHAADLVKGVKGAWEWDLSMAKARKALDWEKQIELAIDPVKAGRRRSERNPGGAEACSMCGNYCAMKIVSEYLGKPIEKC